MTLLVPPGGSSGGEAAIVSALRLAARSRHPTPAAAFEFRRISAAWPRSSRHPAGFRAPASFRCRWAPAIRCFTSACSRATSKTSLWRCRLSLAPTSRSFDRRNAADGSQSGNLERIETGLFRGRRRRHADQGNQRGGARLRQGVHGCWRQGRRNHAAGCRQGRCRVLRHEPRRRWRRDTRVPQEHRQRSNLAAVRKKP